MLNTSVSKNQNFRGRGIIFAATLAVIFLHHDPAAAQAPVALASAAKFAVLAGTMVTSTGLTVIYGSLGVSPGGVVTGTPTVNGSTQLDNPISAQAQADLAVAYNDAAGRTLNSIAEAGNIGGLVLPPGLYTSGSSLAISSGDLTLDGQNNTNGVWIFQAGSTLITTTGNVILIRGAQASNVFWQVGSSATIGTSTIFKGTIMAKISITVQTGATVEGRALAENYEVDLDSNSISNGLPMALSFGPTTRAPDGAVTLVITNTPNFLLTLQISTDLINWTNLTTITPNATPYSFTDTTPSGQAIRYYRAHY
ncbi:MAG TPA: ice-binding family protein [Candidatus Saccharimonadales bacterium]|nr:ice-binding family protein [Candidatus Saccharimonadales bacterium]